MIDLLKFKVVIMIGVGSGVGDFDCQTHLVFLRIYRSLTRAGRYSLSC